MLNGDRETSSGDGKMLKDEEKVLNFDGDALKGEALNGDGKAMAKR